MNRDASRAWTAELYRRFLPGEPDAYAAFLGLAASLCPPGGRVIDLGCGGEGYLSCLMERAGEVVGIDHRQMRGPYHSYLQADLDRVVPVDEESVDLAACKFLVEHLQDPATFLRQVRAALRPGGHLVIMTPNILYYPYAINFALSRLLMQERRMRIVGLFSGRQQADIFPVHYRCNTPRRLRNHLEGAGYRVVHLGTYSDYAASAVCRPLGALAVAYEIAAQRTRAVNAKGFIVAAAVRR
ncbi:MAG: class I SAM-dependent methyltransferase [Actinomycetota bacterium]